MDVNLLAAQLQEVMQLYAELRRDYDALRADYEALLATTQELIAERDQLQQQVQLRRWRMNVDAQHGPRREFAQHLALPPHFRLRRLARQHRFTRVHQQVGRDAGD